MLFDAHRQGKCNDHSRHDVAEAVELVVAQEQGDQQAGDEGVELRTGHHQTVHDSRWHLPGQLRCITVGTGQDRHIENACKEGKDARQGQTSDGEHEHGTAVENCKRGGEKSDSNQVLFSLIKEHAHQVAPNDAREDEDDPDDRNLCRGELGREERRQAVAQRDVAPPDNYEGEHVVDEVMVLEQGRHVLSDAHLRKLAEGERQFARWLVRLLPHQHDAQHAHDSVDAILRVNNLL